MDRLKRSKKTRTKALNEMKKNVLIFVCILLTLNPYSLAFSGFTEQANAEGLTVITDVDGLYDIANNLAGSYQLGANIDLSEVENWQPIGSDDVPFSGIFDGNGYTISGMDGTYEGEAHDGLFTKVSENAILIDVVVEFNKDVETEVANDTEKSLEQPGLTDSVDNLKIEDESSNDVPDSFSPLMTAADGMAGKGTLQDPFQITTAEQLDMVRYNLSSAYKLMADIDLNVAPFNEGEGWVPIGNSENQFTGTFDGNSYTITGLTINRPKEDRVGLFGDVRTPNSSLKNITLKNVNVIGSNQVGGLVGYILAGEITKISVSGNVQGNNEIGSLAGFISNINLTNSEATGTVIGNEKVGGLVGYMSAGKTFTNNRTDIDVTGSRMVGGLIGETTGTFSYSISHSYSAGTVNESSGTSTSLSANIGGLVGYLASFTISKSYSTSKVNGKSTGGRTNIGGLVGNAHSGKISESYATGNVESSSTAVGGLVGNNQVAIEDAYALGSVKGSNQVGGLVGNNTGTVKNSYAVGSVTTSGADAGGLIGNGGAHVITNSYYNSETAGREHNGIGNPKTTAELQQYRTFVDWNFLHVWIIAGSNEYPRFLQEGEEGIQTGTLYVKAGANGDGSSWDNAFGSLQEALDKAVSGNEIWIAEGTYLPTALRDEHDPRTAHFNMKNRVSIYGGFPNSGDPTMEERNPNKYITILSGDLAGDDISGNFKDNRKDNAYSVFINSNRLDSGTILDGVTITGGHSEKNSYLTPDGGGIKNTVNEIQLTLRNVKVTNNFAEERGGGIFAGNADIILENSTISNNESAFGGGIHITGGSLSANSVKINENKATNAGGGILNSSGHVQFINAEIRGNEAYSNGGGIFTSYGSNTSFINALMTGNIVRTSGGAAVHSVAGSPQVSEHYDSYLTFINATISNNWTLNHNPGGAMYLTAFNYVTIKNSIIWDNFHTSAKEAGKYEPQSISYEFVSDIFNLDFYNSTIQGFSDGDDRMQRQNKGGTIDENPHFIAAVTSSEPTVDGDFRIQSSSPVINKGNNEYISGIHTDLAGNDRIIAGTVDMGAYEALHLDADREIQSIITTINDQTVDFDTPITTLELPTKVDVQLNNQSTVALDVAWDEGNPVYNKEQAGTYIFTGTLQLRDDITNPHSLTIQARVVVNPKPTIVQLDEPIEVHTSEIVKIADTNTTLTLPEDLPVGTELEIEKVELEAENLQTAGEMFNFKFKFPENEVNYTGKFTLSLGVNENVDHNHIAKTGIYYFNEKIGDWEYVGGWGEATEGTITIEVNHFSTYAVLTDLEGPKNLAIAQEETTANSVNLSFSATDPSGVKEYIILNSDEEIGRVNAEEATFTITDLASETEYTFTVLAVDRLGNESDRKSIIIETEAKEQIELFVTHIAELTDIVVPVGTEDVNLPTKVNVTTSDEQIHVGEIEWEASYTNYDGNTPGEYIFRGFITLPVEVIDSWNIFVFQKVIVKLAEQEPETPDENDPIDETPDETDPIKITPGQLPIEVLPGASITISGTNSVLHLPSDLPLGTTLKIELQEDVQSPGLTVAGDVFDFIFTYPNGMEDFKGDFTLALKINDDVDVQKVAIYHYHATDERWERIGGKVENGTIVASVEHFSIYGVFVETELADQEDVTTPVIEDESSVEDSNPIEKLDANKETDSGKSTISTTSKGKNTDQSLPNTATTNYTYVLTGILLFVFGITIYLFRKKLQIKIK